MDEINSLSEGLEKERPRLDTKFWERHVQLMTGEMVFAYLLPHNFPRQELAAVIQEGALMDLLEATEVAMEITQTFCCGVFNN